MKDFIESRAGGIFIMGVLLLISSAAAILVVVYLPNRDVVYVMFANLVGNFSGSLLTLLHSKGTSVDASGGKDVEVNVSGTKTTPIVP